jgi:iron complex outermembrane receptor protein
MPIDNLTIRATYAWLNAEIKESGRYVNSLCVSPADLGLGVPAPDQPTSCPGIGELAGNSVEGNFLPQSPEHKVALNVNYMFNFEDGSTLLPSVSWYWRDKFYSTIFNDDSQLTDSYAQTDARLIWNDASGTFTVIGWARNVFDEEGYDLQTAFKSRSLDPTRNNQIYQSTTYTLPRTYGVELQVHF